MTALKPNPTPPQGLLPIEVLCAYGPRGLDVLARDDRGRYHWPHAGSQDC